MDIINEGGLKLLKFKAFSELKFLEHCFTSRIGGYSASPYDSLNMGLKTSDESEVVLKNYSKVAELVFDSKLEDLALADQVHKCEIAIVTEEDRGKGVIPEKSYSEIDGLVTAQRGIVLSTVYADCTPLFFADPENKVVGVAHAGWKGTVGGIGSNMVKLMSSEFGSVPEDIIVGIGPTIGPCCYNVKSDVAAKFQAVLGADTDILKPNGENSWSLNLWEANRKLLEQNGIKRENISIGGYCTACNPELFYSYRRDSGNTGRMAAMIKLNY